MRQRSGDTRQSPSRATSRTPQQVLDVIRPIRRPSDELVHTTHARTGRAYNRPPVADTRQRRRPTPRIDTVRQTRQRPKRRRHQPEIAHIGEPTASATPTAEFFLNDEAANLLQLPDPHRDRIPVPAQVINTGATERSDNSSSHWVSGGSTRGGQLRISRIRAADPRIQPYELSVANVFERARRSEASRLWQCFLTPRCLPTFGIIACALAAYPRPTSWAFDLEGDEPGGRFDRPRSRSA
jgi:hypothetical protein